MPGQHCVRAAADRKLIPGDVPYDDPMNSSIQFETDFIPFKLATDVVLNGKAYAPRGRLTQELTASLMVGQARKDVRVIGDRQCRHRDKGDPLFTDPQSFTTMELRYERAYGGIDIYSDPSIPCPYLRNPLGCGFVVGGNKRTIDSLVLPNLEDPNEPAHTRASFGWSVPGLGEAAVSQNFGWFPMTWLPRASLAGVMPAERQLHEEMHRLTLRPSHPNSGSCGRRLGYPTSTSVSSTGPRPAWFCRTCPATSGSAPSTWPRGAVGVSAPRQPAGISVDFGLGVHVPPVVLHTVMIRMEDRQLDLVWRTAAAPYPGPDWLSEMQKMEVVIQ